jgi:acyl-CoA thioester hydrolase
VRVVVSSRARSDILEVHAYLSERSLIAADRALIRFSERFNELCDFPLLGPDRSELRASLRGLIIDGYVAFYIVEVDRIVIVRVLDGDGRHHMQVRVYYEDTDFSGIVYHANYLRFMERGRTNHLRLMGASQQALFEQAQVETPGFAFVVRSMELDFLRPARMDDILDVVTWPIVVKGASITLAQEVRRSGEVLVKAAVRVAFICEGKAQPIPKSLRLLMKADLAPE